MARDVFVSYCQPDRECAFEIVALLEGRGFSVWVAPRDIAPSADWAEEIVNAIGGARLMLLVFSAHCNGSPQVRREVERAVHRAVPVLPFRIEEVLPTGSMEYFLSTQHWLDAFPAPRNAHERLLDHVERLLRPPIAATAPTAQAVDHSALERRLAHYVGPIAPHLVRRALHSGVRGQALLEALAAEIDSPQQRREFLAERAALQ